MKCIKWTVLFVAAFSLVPTCSRSNSGQAATSKTSTEQPAGTRTITDHAGNTVEIPVNPKRIASLHTMTTTHMLWDLGLPLIGTATRLLKGDEGNRPYIRSVEEVFGVKFQDTDLANYGKKGEDIERIKASKPDLIVGTFYQKDVYDKLSNIAPTILIDQSSADMFSVYKDLAAWVGESGEFDKRYAIYKKKLAQVRSKFSTPPDEQTFAYVKPRKGKASYKARKAYGAITTVAYDLGFKMAPYILEQIPEETSSAAKLSAETFPLLKTDWLLSTYDLKDAEGANYLYSGLDEIAPGWRDYLSAYKNNQIIVLASEISHGMSFQTLDMLLDQFEQMAK